MRLEDVPRFPCSRITKAPLVAGGFKAATNDPEKLRAWREQFPRALWGLLCGEAFDVLDIDPAGLNWLSEHESEMLTRVQFTPRGRHYFFLPDPGLRPSVGKVAEGCDVRSRGSYVIDWSREGLRTIEHDLAPWPPWLLLAASAPAESIKNGGRKMDGPLLVGAGRVPKALYFKVLSLVPLSNTITCRHQRRVLGILRMVTQKSQYRNDTLNIAAFCFRELIRSGIVNRAAAESLLLDAATINGYVSKDGRRAAIATIRSGLGPANCGPSTVIDVQGGAA